MRHNRIAVIVAVQGVQCFRILAFFQQFHAPHVCRVLLQQSIHEREHRGDDVGERVGGRQSVAAVVDAEDLAFERHGHALRGHVGRYLLRIVVGHHVAALHDRIQPRILRVGKLHEAVERGLPPEGVGTETFDIGFVLPVVALLQKREATSSDYEVFEFHASIGLMQYGRNDYAAAASQKLLRERYHKVKSYLTVAFGYGAHLRRDGHLFDFERHHALAVRKRVDRREVESAAVALELHDLRAVVGLPLLPLGARELRQPRCHLPPRKRPRDRAAEEQAQRADDEARR